MRQLAVSLETTANRKAETSVLYQWTCFGSACLMLCSVYIYTYGAHAVCVSLQQGWISAQLLSLPLTTHPQVQTGWVSATLLVLLCPLGFLGCFFKIVFLILFPGILPSVCTHKWFFVWNTLCFLLCFHIPQLCHSSVFCSFQRNLVFLSSVWELSP